MPSPFPGMNPYLEQQAVWHDFHDRFVPAAAEFLGGQLAPHYIVKVEEHIFPARRRRGAAAAGGTH